jgi:hypothetical protein
MDPLRGRHIVLGVAGSVAAYKAADVARRLLAVGAQVTAVLTAGAQRFITPLTLTALTGRPALTDSFDLPSGSMPHLDLAKNAAAILVAPTSANLLARLAAGSADDLLTSRDFGHPSAGDFGPRHARTHVDPPGDPAQRGDGSRIRLPNGGSRTGRAGQRRSRVLAEWRTRT